MKNQPKAYGLQGCCLWVAILVLCLFSPVASGQNRPPVARYMFNDGFGPLYESAVKPEFRGTTPVQDRFGNPTCAMYLHGNPYSYINLGNNPALKPVAGSVSLWVKIEHAILSGKGVNSNPILLTKSITTDDFFEAYGIFYSMYNERFEMAMSKVADSDTIQTVLHSANPVKLNTWYHVVISWNDSFTCMYVNGKLNSKLEKNFSTTYLETDSVMIGNSANKKNERFFNGTVDDIEFFDRVITPQEVQLLYQAPDPNKYGYLRKWITWGLLAIVLAGGIALSVYFRLKKQIKREQEKRALQQKVHELEMRAIKAQIHPHFISNMLVAIQRLMLENETDKAMQYVAKFNTLLRHILRHSDRFLVDLHDELDMIDLIIELEQLRFGNKFIFEKQIDQAVLDEEIFIPPLLVQPIIENAVWHGLLPLQAQGTPKLILRVSFAGEHLVISIIDNGAGINSQKQARPEKESVGLDLVKRWIESLNRFFPGQKARIEIHDLKGTDSSGTAVDIIFPVHELNELSIERDEEHFD